MPLVKKRSRNLKRNLEVQYVTNESGVQENDAENDDIYHGLKVYSGLAAIVSIYRM